MRQSILFLLILGISELCVQAMNHNRQIFKQSQVFENSISGSKQLFYTNDKLLQLNLSIQQEQQDFNANQAQSNAEQNDDMQNLDNQQQNQTELIIDDSAQVQEQQVENNQQEQQNNSETEGEDDNSELEGEDDNSETEGEDNNSESEGEDVIQVVDNANEKLIEKDQDIDLEDVDDNDDVLISESLDQEEIESAKTLAMAYAFDKDEDEQEINSTNSVQVKSPIQQSNKKESNQKLIREEELDISEDKEVATQPQQDQRLAIKLEFPEGNGTSSQGILGQGISQVGEQISVLSTSLNDAVQFVNNQIDQNSQLTATSSLMLIDTAIKEKKRQLDIINKEIENLQSKIEYYDSSICSDYTNCDNCNQMPECGWCESSKTCLVVNKNGPVDQNCTNFMPFECPIGCENLQTCSECVQFEQCGWCQNGKFCGDYYTINCADDFLYSLKEQNVASCPLNQVSAQKSNDQTSDLDEMRINLHQLQEQQSILIEDMDKLIQQRDALSQKASLESQDIIPMIQGGQNPTELQEKIDELFMEQSDEQLQSTVEDINKIIQQASATVDEQVQGQMDDVVQTLGENSQSVITQMNEIAKEEQQKASQANGGIASLLQTFSKP